MLKGNQLKFQRGAAAKTEGEDRNNGGENRPHVVTVRPARENHQLFSALWRFEQGQRSSPSRRRNDANFEQCGDHRASPRARLPRTTGGDLAALVGLLEPGIK